MGRTARMRRPRASLEQGVPAAYNGYIVRGLVGLKPDSSAIPHDAAVPLEL
jgi:hypothetical protein